jgi:hypothetical protein
MAPTLTPELREIPVVPEVLKAAIALCVFGTREGDNQLPAVFQSSVPGLADQVWARP